MTTFNARVGSGSSGGLPIQSADCPLSSSAQVPFGSLGGCSEAPSSSIFCAGIAIVPKACGLEHRIWPAHIRVPSNLVQCRFTLCPPCIRAMAYFSFPLSSLSSLLIPALSRLVGPFIVVRRPTLTC